MIEIMILKGKTKMGIIPFNLLNASRFELIEVINDEKLLKLSTLYKRYNISVPHHSYEDEVLDGFKSISQVNKNGEHIWFHLSTNSDYQSLLRIVTIHDIIKDDTIS